MSETAWWDIDATSATETGDSRPPDRELLEEGEHRLQIKAVTDGDARLEISLAPTDRRFGWVFCKLPKGAGWAARIAKSLAAALRISPAAWPAAVRDGDLIDRWVIARVYQRVDSSGKTWVNVAEFKPTPELVAADEAPKVETAAVAPKVERAVAPPARRTPTKKADAANADTDDIPF